MEETKQRLKVYCETTFWSYLNGGSTPLEHIAVKQAFTHPDTEATDASHIATAAVYGMDVLLTWNCRHMANPVTLPKTAMLVCRAGYTCPIIVTPQEFLDRKEEFGYEN